MARWLGIDVGSKVVRLALLRTGYGRTVVETLREVRIDPNAPSETAEPAAVDGAALLAALPSPEPDAASAATDAPAWIEQPLAPGAAPSPAAGPGVHAATLPAFPALGAPPLEPAWYEPPADPGAAPPAPVAGPLVTDGAADAATVAADAGGVVAEAAAAPTRPAPEAPLPPKPTAEAALRAAAAGLRPDAQAAAIVGARGFLRRVTLPAAAQKELGRVLSFEVESTLPFELDDAVMDHRVLQSAPGADGKRQLLILAAVALTEHVRERIGLVERATGAQPDRVGMGVLPLANLAQIAPELRKPGVVGLLEVEEDRTDLLVLSAGEPQFARSLTHGTDALPDGPAPLLRELRQTIAAWRLEGGNPLERLYLLGSGKSVPELGGLLAAELALPVGELALPGLDGLGRHDPARIGAFAKAIALGLGLSRRPADLNLRRGALEAQQTYSFLREKTPLLAGLLTAIAVSFGFYLLAEIRGLDAEHSALAGELATVTRNMLGEETREPERATELLERALAGKSEDPLPEMDAFGVMVELSKRVPKEITHDVTEFDFNRGTVVIRGIVSTIEDGQAVANKMAEHRCFRDVKIARFTKLGEENKQKYQLEFTIKCEAAKKPPAAGTATGSASAAPKAPPSAPKPASSTKPGASP